MHCFFAADLLGGAENPECSTHVVMKILSAFADEELACFSLVIDQARHHFTHFGYESHFVFSKRRLVADLVEIAHELGAFAKEPSDGDIDLIQRAKNFVNLFGCDEGWQVKHHADSQTGSDIGRAGGQVAKSLVVRVGEFAFELIVELVHALPSGFKVKAALHDLDTQMVFLVDHNTEAFVWIEDDRPGTLALAEFVADQLAFH